MIKTKKFLSLVTAAAISASALAGMVFTANAATDLYTYTDGSTSGWTISTGGSVSTVTDDDGDAYLKVSGGGGGERVATYSISGTSSATDNYVIEFDSLIHGANGMGRSEQATQIAIGGSSMAVDTRTLGTNSPTSIGKGFAVKYDTRREYQGKGIVVNDPATDVPTDWTTFANYSSTFTQDTWTRTQAVISGNKATITVIDSAGNKLVDGVEYDCTSAAPVKMQITCARGELTSGDGGLDPGFVYLDNMHIYSGDPETLTTDGLRGDAVAVATAVPAPETVAGAAPVLTAPSSVTSDVYTANMNSAATGTVIELEGETQTPKPVVDGLTASVGSRSGGETTTYASIVNVADGDNALKLSAGAYATNGRGPIVSLDDELEISSGETAIMGFAVYLSKNTPTGTPKLYLLDNTTNVDGNSVARDVLAVITTEDASGYANGDTKIGIQVDEGWHTIVVAVSEGTYRVFVDEKYKNDDGDLSPAVKGTKVGTGETSVQVTSLPKFAVANSNADNGSGRACDLIDNIITYKITETIDAKYLPNVTTADATVTPEPAATADGSNIDLLPDGAEKVTDMSAAEGTAAAVLNHSAAKPATDGTTVSVYKDKNVRGNSIYTAFDVYVKKGDVLKLTEVGSDSTKIGSAFVFTGKESGALAVTYIDAKDDGGGTVTTDLACETWYRVVIETPQNNNEGDTNTGASNLTIYRIDPTDCTKTTKVAAEKTGISARNLSDRAFVSITVSATGTPYIDNGVVYLASQSNPTATPTPEATPTPRPTAAPAVKDMTAAVNKDAGTVTLSGGTLPDGSESVSAVVIVAHYADGDTTGVPESVTISDTVTYTGTETAVTIDNGLHTGDKVFVWNTVGLDGYVPCCAAQTVE